MIVLDMPFVTGLIRMASDGWKLGWHERNGGNISYRIKNEDVEKIKDDFDPGEWIEIGTEIENLKNEFFLMTASGSFFRNIGTDPETNLCIIETDDYGRNYRVVWGLGKGGKPTSELPSHLMNLAVKKKADPDYRVVYHAHPANIIALTFVLPLSDEVFTRELWEMMPECMMVFPEGIGVVEWMIPGGKEIAIATSEAMKRYDLAVWAHHGVFAAGRNYDLTFGLMHTAEKAAEILVKVLSITPQKRQTVRSEQLKSMAEALNLRLSERIVL